MSLSLLDDLLSGLLDNLLSGLLGWFLTGFLDKLLSGFVDLFGDNFNLLQSFLSLGNSLNILSFLGNFNSLLKSSNLLLDLNLLLGGGFDLFDGLFDLQNHLS